MSLHMLGAHAPTALSAVAIVAQVESIDSDKLSRFLVRQGVPGYAAPAALTVVSAAPEGVLNIALPLVQPMLEREMGVRAKLRAVPSTAMPPAIVRQEPGKPELLVGLGVGLAAGLSLFSLARLVARLWSR